MNENAFIAEILRKPEEIAPKLVFSDWLEEQGDPRADVIRKIIDDISYKKEWVEGEWWDGFKTEVSESGLTRKQFSLFAADCAETVLPAWEVEFRYDKRPKKAIEAARTEDVWNQELHAEFERAIELARSWVNHYEDNRQSRKGLNSEIAANAAAAALHAYATLYGYSRINAISYAKERATEAAMHAVMVRVEEGVRNSVYYENPYKFETSPLAQKVWSLKRLAEYQHFDGQPIFTCGGF